MDLTPWQPYKMTFMPIDFYIDGEIQLNDQGLKLVRACFMVDVKLMMIMKG